MSDQRSLFEEFELNTEDFQRRIGGLYLPFIKLGEFIGYAQPSDSVNTLVSRHPDEFKPLYLTITSMVSGRENLMHFDGCLLATMFARTERAHDFRLALIRLVYRERLKKVNNVFNKILNRYTGLSLGKCKQIACLSSYLDFELLASVYNMNPEDTQKMSEVFPELYQEDMNDPDLKKTFSSRGLFVMTPQQVLCLAWYQSSADKKKPLTAVQLEKASSLIMSSKSSEEIERDTGIAAAAIDMFRSWKHTEAA